MSPTEAAALVERVERGDADKAEVAKLCEWWRNQRVSLQMRHDELDAARADLAEALTALRELYEAHDIGERDLEPYKREAIIDDATERARALLVKHGRLPA